MHSYRSAHCALQGWVAELSLPLHGTVSGLGFATGQAGSPMHLAESSSTLLCLWTGLSLPVALHPASQRRSYLQLRTGQCSRPEGTFTLLLVRTFRRTFPRHFVPGYDRIVPTGRACRHFATASSLARKSSLAHLKGK